MRTYAILALVISIGSIHAATRPNILFAISDDQSFPHTGAYGCTWVKTPGFDRVAREGILFMRAYTPNAKCAPSRTCIVTGRNSWQLEEAANHWPNLTDKFKTYAEVLSENGYDVAYTGKGWGPGKISKGRQVTGRNINKHKTKPPARGISGNNYSANFKSFLDEQTGDKPWCFWYGGYEPHRAYEFKAGATKGGKKISDIDRVPKFWPDNEAVRHDMLDYAFEVEYFDHHLVRILNELEKSGQLENTIVLVTADNGMPFPRVKGQEYEMSNHLPLAAMWPKGIANPGRTVTDYVSFIDFAPTFLEAAGVSPKSSGMDLPGRSLFDVFKSPKSGQVNPKRDHVVIGKERHDIGRPHDQGYPIRGIVKNNMLYLQNFKTDRWPAGNPETGYLNTDGSPTKTEVLNKRRDGSAPQYWQKSFGKRQAHEFFNVEKDPECMNNLAANPEYAAIQDEMRKQLIATLKRQGDPRMEGQGDIFDKYPYTGAQRGFYERIQAGEKIGTGWVNKSDYETEKLDD